MPDRKNPALHALSLPLFWRTLLLILALMAAGLLAWVPTVRLIEREPRAHQIAQQLVSIVHATRAALVYSDPQRRRELVADMFDNESLRVVPLEPGDRVEPNLDTPLADLIEREVKERLGASTRLATEVNGARGTWVSFSIDGDAYWVYIDRDLRRRDLGRGWIASAAMATIVSLLAAIAMVRVVNLPLAALTRAAGELGAGRTPATLPETGPVEIRTVNRSFNRMAQDLAKIEHDRAVLLAGISHDLRTPLTRLRLELELNGLPESARRAMAGDLDQIDAIVGQFLDFALPAPSRAAIPVDLSELVEEALARRRLGADPAEPGDAPSGEDGATATLGPVRLSARVERGAIVTGHPTELARAIDNLLANALRYGRDESGALDLEVSVAHGAQGIVLAVADHGPGISAADRGRLLRPFERGESSRSGGGGAGLGLAIVERVARMHGASLGLRENPPRGLRVEIVFRQGGDRAAAAPGGEDSATAQ
jgi:two-component system osmolarity sensor histidine kinase EnvZ